MTEQYDDKREEEAHEEWWPGEWESAADATTEPNGEDVSEEWWPGEWESAADATAERGGRNGLAETVQRWSDTSDASSSRLLTADAGDGSSYLYRRISLVLSLLLVFTVVLSVAGFGSFSFLPGPSSVPVTRSLGLRLLLILLMTSIVALVSLTYMSFLSQEDIVSSTEFYVLSAEGNSTDLPLEATVGEETRVTIGVANHEETQETYTVIVTANDRTLRKRTLMLADEETTEQPLTFSLRQPGSVEIQFLLYRGDDPDTSSSPYRSVSVVAIATSTG